MMYQPKIRKDKRSTWDIFCARMYRHYIEEKELYKETDVLSENEYVEKNKEFLINKLTKEPLL